MTTLKIEYWCASCDSTVKRIRTTPLSAETICPVCDESSLQINFIEEVDPNDQSR